MNNISIDKTAADKSIVSVIIPVYNSAKYLDKCLNSIREQSYQFFEVLLIDDGSQDCSKDICQKYCDNDQRFRYFYQTNRGVSCARNTGLQMARGKYICFVDADDYVDNKYLEVLLCRIKEKDMAVCGYYRINSAGDVIISNLKGQRITKVYSAEEYAKVLFTDVHNYQGYLWNKVYRSDIIKENNILFSENIFYNEDRLFVLEYLIKCHEIFYTDLPLYRYLIHEESVMGQIQKSFNVKMITELDAFQRMQDILKDMWKQTYSLCLFNSFYAAYSLKQKCCSNQKINSYVSNWLLRIMFERNITGRNKLKCCYYYFC